MTDFSALGDAEITDQAELFKAAECGRKAADEAALAINQYYADLLYALTYIPVVEGRAPAKARRVARHAKRAMEQMKSVRESFKKIPEDFNKTYEAELAMARNRDRKRFDINK